LLTTVPVRKLVVTAAPGVAHSIDIDVDPAKVDRLVVDVDVDGRLRASLDAAEAVRRRTYRGAGGQQVRIEGFAADLAAASTVSLRRPLG
jgi:hypothetical protein